MAKPAKYPKKLRQKLEKVAAARDERESYDELMRIGNNYDPFRTLWHEFMQLSGVHVMRTRIDEDHHRISTYNTLIPDFPMEQVSVEPPWPTRGSASE